MKWKYKLVIVALVVSCSAFFGCSQPQKEPEWRVIARTTFDAGALAMMSAIRENPDVATQDGNEQLLAAKKWWRKHNANPFPLKPEHTNSM